MADADAQNTETTEETAAESTEAAEAFSVDESAEATEADGSAADDTSSEGGTEAFQTEEDDAETASSDDEGTGSEEEGGSEAPEEYEAFEVPDGMQVEDTLMDAFRQRAKEDGLTQEQAQRRLDHVAELKQQADEQARGFWADRTKTWSEASKEAGLLSKETMAMASVGLSKAPGGPEVSKLLSQLGLDKNPAVITAFSELGKKMSPDTDTARRTEGAQGGSDAAAADEAAIQARKERLYPNEAKQE